LLNEDRANGIFGKIGKNFKAKNHSLY